MPKYKPQSFPKLPLKEGVISLYSNPYKAFIMIVCHLNYLIFNIKQKNYLRQEEMNNKASLDDRGKKCDLCNVKEKEHSQRSMAQRSPSQTEKRGKKG